MAQQITCQYVTYDLPTDVSPVGIVASWTCEQFDLPWRQQKRDFTVSTDFPDQLLKHGTAVEVAGGRIGRDKPAKFKVESWALGVDAGGALLIEARVRELKLSPLGRLLESHDQAGFLIALLSIVIPLVGSVFLFSAGYYFPTPEPFWGWVGRHIQTFVGWSLFVLVLWVFFWSHSRIRDRPYLSRAVPILLGMMLWLAPVAWLFVSEPPKPLDGSDAAGIAYLNYLKERIATLPLLLAGILPWLLLAMKIVKLDSAMSVIETWKDQTPAPQRADQV
jgi:hypothetical protein